MKEEIRALAFYLPQFHPIPENDDWWGKGFTEWTNVTRARPRYPGHYQPHLPADLGFYDLRLPEAREAQALLAREYGIHGFCYYHYWFNGRRVLERPFSEVLASGKPDFPFCLCWANENWTRAWDGSEREILLEQHYNHEDDINHIRSLIPALRDDRYIKIDDKPLLLVYRTNLLPDPKRTAEIWREEAVKAGLKGLYLVRVESFGNTINPHDIGFDAATEFAPFGGQTGKLLKNTMLHKLLSKAGLVSDAYFENSIVSYDSIVKSMLAKPAPDYTYFRSVTPSWDNCARRKKGAFILDGATPEKYEAWLHAAKQITLQNNRPSEQLIFINAWNEWAEGNHLEPDLHWGRAYLEATTRALANESNSELLKELSSRASSQENAPPLKKMFWKIAELIK